MGYPMTYKRVVARNSLHGGYEGAKPFDETASSRLPWIAGDLRRLEHDQRDELHIRQYAKLAGVSRAKAKLILDAFFGDVELPFVAMPKSWWETRRGL